LRFVLITASDRVAARLVADSPASLRNQFDAIADWAADD